MKILLVEDDLATCTLLTKALAVHHTVDVTQNGRSALELAELGAYDLVLLDVDIPELDGIRVCQQLRVQGHQMPILLLTAKDETSDRVLGLDAGADDYMVKPFHLPELLARIRALLRRSRTTVASIVTWEQLQLDCLTHEIRYGEQPLRLTPKEYGILELLLLNPQRIFSRAVMINRLWDIGEPPTESAISSHIKAIRQKLKAAGAQQDLIETMYGFGYRLRPLEAMPPLHPTSSEVAGTEAMLQAAADTLMADLWERFQDSFSLQLDVLDRAVVALQAGSLATDKWQEAKQIAHKLVGSLGVYGLPQGSALARQMETVFQTERSLTAPELEQLTAWLFALRQELHQKNKSPSLAVVSKSEHPLVLLVDDDPALTERLQAEADDRSLHLIIAADPIAAQAILDRTLPDVILLDLTFSDGHAAGLNWLETLQQQHSQIPVLVFTERDDLSDRLAVARLGARQFLHKPATPEQIFHAIARVLPRPPVSDMRVLIVDDDPGMLGFLSSILTPWGIDVTTLSNPQDFWQVLVATAPNLILLDLEMPHVSGLELCQVVRQDSQWGDLPILVVTAHTDADSLQQAFAAGADDFITKPILGPELVTRVLSRIDRTRLHQ